MISQEDYTFIVALDNATESAVREKLLREQRTQCAKTFLSLLGHVSKDQTIQYILVMLDDMLQVCIISLSCHFEFIEHVPNSNWIKWTLKSL
jgi:V-type H+-transporting ATPase subunit H